MRYNNICSCTVTRQPLADGTTNDMVVISMALDTLVTTPIVQLILSNNRTVRLCKMRHIYCWVKDLLLNAHKYIKTYTRGAVKGANQHTYTHHTVII